MDSTGCELESEKWILLDINKTIVFDCNKIHFSFRHLQRIRFIRSYIHKQFILICVCVHEFEHFKLISIRILSESAVLIERTGKKPHSKALIRFLTISLWLQSPLILRPSITSSWALPGTPQPKRITRMHKIWMFWALKVHAGSTNCSIVHTPWLTNYQILCS